MYRYRCSKSGYVYDPRRGDPTGGILPGTPFVQVPESWRCPRCGANKNAFAVVPAEAVDANAEDAVATADEPTEPPPKPVAVVTPVAKSTWTVGSLKKPIGPG